MAAPPTILTIGTRIFSASSVRLQGATVTLTFENTVIELKSNVQGEAIFNAGKAGAVVGDTVSIKAIKVSEGQKTIEVIVAAQPQTLEITLAYTSDLTAKEGVQDTHVMNFALLTDFSGEKHSPSNPVPVSDRDNILNEPAITNTYDSQNRLSTQTITVNSIDYIRTFGYTGNQFQFITRTAWTKV